jgi:hypothetical protein
VNEIPVTLLGSVIEVEKFIRLMVRPLSSPPHFKEKQHTVHTRCQAFVLGEAVFVYPKHKDACAYSSSP